MAQIEDRSGSKSANVELNLVPFIDLMCVCITFLLITAVWTQVSMIQLGTSIYGKSAVEQVDIPLKKSDIVFRLDVKPYGFVLNIGLAIVKIPKIEQRYDEDVLREELLKIKEKYPKKTDVVIAIEDNLPYDLMVRAMDQLIGVGFIDIGIATGAVR